MGGGNRAFRPFATRGRRVIGAILLTFGLFSALSVTLSIRAAARSQNQAVVVEVAARQRTLAERYVKELLLARTGAQADPAAIAALLSQSANVLLEGGKVPSVEGDDDETTVIRQNDALVRLQLKQEQRLVADLTATGSAILAERPVDHLPTTAKEHLAGLPPLQRLRVLAALTSNVALNSARTIAVNADHNVSSLIVLQIVTSKYGLLPQPDYVSPLHDPLGWASGMLGAWITLAAVYAALYIRLTRAKMLETLTEDYIRTAQAKGLSRGRVIFKHGLRSALTPIVTIAGLDLASVLGGAAVTEVVFNLNGIGKIGVDAIRDLDLPVIVAVVLIAATAVVVLNFAVDLLYAVIDPRVRYT